MSEKNLQIEGMRGIACFLVMAHHLIWSFCYNYMNVEWAKKCADYAYLGRFGVFFFFCISFWFIRCGDVEKFDNNYKSISISGCFLRKVRSCVKVAFRNIAKLYKKLWIPYALSISLIFIITCIWKGLDLSVSVKTYLVNLTMLSGLIPHIDFVDGAHWYIASLLFGTLVVSVIETCNKWRNIWYILWLVVSYALSGIIPGHLYEFSGIIVIIICEKRIRQSIIERKIRTYIWEYFVLLLGIVYSLKVLGPVQCLVFLIANTIFVLCYVGAIPVLRNRMVVWVGSMSLYIYLIHQKISYIIEYYIFKCIGKYTVWIAIIAMIISIVLAVIVKLCTEQISKGLICVKKHFNNEKM